mmetsp:Transcript_40733/g.93729  ORF Transcript_40733/g.93729 Transcript_40733/m.93729 type:complete len:684 (-) Transcript_40733:72-2123(-)
MKLLGICLALAATWAMASPVEQVVHLLEDLQTKVSADGAQEEKIFNKYACWCEKASMAKAEAIETAEDELKSLGILILKLKGGVATLASEIQQLSKQLEENAEAQAEATSLRQKENEAFQVESTETKQALAALEKAIAVLVKGSTPEKSAALLQQPYSAMKDSVLAAFGSSLAPESHAILLQALASAKDKYAPQSMTVQGLLSDMYSTFSKDLEKATKLEVSRNKAFEGLISSLKDAETSMTAAKQAKANAKSEAEAQLAAATQSYDDTEKQKDADIAFFDSTARDCSAKKEEWHIRQKLRADELAGIKKAISILSDEEARELFAKKNGQEVATSFLQADKVTAETARSKAYKALRTQATNLRSLRLAQLAASVRQVQGGAFFKVLASIDAMVQTLKDEDAADVKKKDQCADEYAQSEQDIAAVSWRIEKSAAKINNLNQALKANEKEQGATIKAIQEVDDEMTAMKAARAEENAAFEEAKKDDQKAVALLQQARAALSEYYTNNGMSMSLLAATAAPAPAPALDFIPAPPDATFSSKDEHQLASQGIVGIMSLLIEDLNNGIRESVKEEAAAQESFMQELATAADLKKSLAEKHTNLEEAAAALQGSLVGAEELQDDQQAELKEEVKYKASIKPDCDWLLGAFDERASKRAAELEALGQAKAYLQGASTEPAPSFLQRHQRR